MMMTVLATIPLAAVDAVMPKTAETIFNVFIFIPLGIAFALALRKLVKGQGPLLLYCILGGALAASFEPVVDVLGLVFFKERGALGTFTILDRTMPLYICFVYPWYVGGLGYLAYKLFKRGVTMRDLLLLWAADFLVDVVLESPGILAGTYLYYGHQPFNFWGFPLWWGFVNPVMPMVAGALIFHILPHLEHAVEAARDNRVRPDGRRHRQRRHCLADVGGAQPSGCVLCLDLSGVHSSPSGWRCSQSGSSVCPLSVAASWHIRSRRRCGTSSKRSQRHPRGRPFQPLSGPRSGHGTCHTFR